MTASPTPVAPPPALLLAEASKALALPASWGSCWSQATAVLARQALEATIDAVWIGPTAAMRSRSFADKLTCLPWYIDPDVARRARHTWHALSNACHAHPYELAPTTSELERWIADVAKLVELVSARSATVDASGEVLR